VTLKVHEFKRAPYDYEGVFAEFVDVQQLSLAEAGGLLTYGVSFPDLWRRAADQVFLPVSPMPPSGWSEYRYEARPPGMFAVSATGDSTTARAP
jgi:hypothetical protein